MSHLYRVDEIFYSLQGEGLQQGLPTLFVRFNGCNLNCNYCDTQYACDYNGDFDEFTEDQLINEIMEGPCPVQYITFTGGEPLLQLDTKLLERLLGSYIVNIETNGTIPISKFQYLNSIITMDHKCAGSGASFSRIRYDNIKELRDVDALKFVVSSIDDLDEMRAIYSMGFCPANFIVSPVIGRIEPQEVARYLLDEGLSSVRMQMQMHKIIWPDQSRGV